MHEDTELLRHYESLLNIFKWQWCGTLTFRSCVTDEVAHAYFFKWIGEIRKKEGTDFFSYVRLIERRSFEHNLCFHFLVGGLRDKRKSQWIKRWNSLAGAASIHYYQRHLADLRHILRSAKPGWRFYLDMRFSD
jgi:hypothetical protein